MPLCTSAALKKPMASVSVRSLSSCAYICASSRMYLSLMGTLSALNLVISERMSALVRALRLPVAEAVCAATAPPVVRTKFVDPGFHLYSRFWLASSMSFCLSWEITELRLSYDSSTVSAWGMCTGSVVSSSRL